MVAERKLRLRRAAVYAAWVESEAKRHGISADDLIRLDAMATYGFAEEGAYPRRHGASLRTSSPSSPGFAEPAFSS
jgi:hypothetical protein